MENGHRSNTSVERRDVFRAVNNYFLLAFAASCMVSSICIQEIFYVAGYYRGGIGASALFGAILPVVLLMRRFGPGMRRQLQIDAPNISATTLVVLATLCAVVVVDQVYLISQRFTSAPDAYGELIGGLRPTGPWSFVVVFLGLCVLAPIAEEFIFRGIIQQVLERNLGGGAALVLAGLLFGAAHLNAQLLMSVCIFGIFLGFVFFATRNLTYTIIAHGLFNTVALVQLIQSPTGGPDSPPFYLRDVRVFVVTAVLLVYLLYKVKQGGPAGGPPWLDTEDTD